MAGLNFLGIKGLDLKVSDHAPRDERQMIHAFNKNYSLDDKAGGRIPFYLMKDSWNSHSQNQAFHRCAR